MSDNLPVTGNPVINGMADVFGWPGKHIAQAVPCHIQSRHRWVAWPLADSAAAERAPAAAYEGGSGGRLDG